ncbi:uncharacterized protein LOC132736887 [Ruditapes philippinarum]|uniref:uncharacterized protein LOC132736887 n=1 Tax=Ruditapes philippinarum TaxID=129788 RepID=UPI00295A8E61|nr:uncharacterized protein LOC132736887 [Ruditapes philippinarum]
MQLKCPVCEEWLETDVCQAVENGHKFHWNCFFKMQSSVERCALCIEDNLPPEYDCFKLKMNEVNVYEDKASMRDMAHEIFTCNICGHAGTSTEIKLHTEEDCENVGCTCAIC